ncbi:MAG: protein kinase [Polaromonas sp.]|nr:protein kinase [Polaromonas sp.]
MTTSILIVEDDDAIRGNLLRLLNLEGFDTLSAPDGQTALERAQAFRPDLVISDINMPGLNGFGLLAAIRGDAALATTPVILLTALDDRDSMRRGMTGGADDYLSKPFTREELLDAVQAQLRKRGRLAEALQSGLAAGEERLRAAFTHSLSGDQPPAFTAQAPAGAVAEPLDGAIVLFSDIRNFTALAEKLDAAEVAELLNAWSAQASQPVLKNGGRHIKFIGEGLMAAFADAGYGSPLPAARRAVSAALAIALAAHDFRQWLGERFPGRGLPPFAVGAGLHAGEVTVCQIGAVRDQETALVGDAVNTAARLESAGRELGWSVIASVPVLGAAGPGIQTGARSPVAVNGQRAMVDAREVTGLITSDDDKLHGMASLTERALEVIEAVRFNSGITARAVKDALDAKLAALSAQGFDPASITVRLKGYRIIRKIGSGGMTEVYLAEREADGLQIVLKVLDSHGKHASDNLVRFIQEYALLSTIRHPSVIRIHDQGFTDEHAYIAMEYFERGDLRALFGPDLTPQRALDVVRQIAEALAAIHASGIVHRDIKPENIMLRSDGSVALADFGIAKSMQKAALPELSQTSHGDVIGTPYYLSPEQAAGKAITPQSDLYSLGVMMFEMLTGRRPFIAESLELLLAKHLNADTPELPAASRHLQPIVNRLMHKSVDTRYATADELLRDLAQV